MKKLIFASIVTLFSFNALSSVELFYRVGNEECHYSENKAVKTVKLWKGELTMTSVKEVSFQGLEEMARKAAIQSSGRGINEDMFEVTIDGDKYKLHHDDSMEAMVLIGALVSACK